MCFLLMQCLAISKWGLVYQEISRDKVVNTYRQSGMLLDDD